jgi:hypothetical protein
MHCVDGRAFPMWLCVLCAILMVVLAQTNDMDGLGPTAFSSCWTSDNPVFASVLNHADFTDTSVLQLVGTGAKNVVLGVEGGAYVVRLTLTHLGHATYKSCDWSGILRQVECVFPSADAKLASPGMCPKDSAVDSPSVCGVGNLSSTFTHMLRRVASVDASHPRDVDTLSKVTTQMSRGSVVANLGSVVCGVNLAIAHGSICLRVRGGVRLMRSLCLASDDVGEPSPWTSLVVSVEVQHRFNGTLQDCLDCATPGHRRYQRPNDPGQPVQRECAACHRMSSAVLLGMMYVYAHDMLRMYEQGLLPPDAHPSNMFVRASTVAGTLSPQLVFGDLGDTTSGRDESSQAQQCKRALTRMAEGWRLLARHVFANVAASDLAESQRLVDQLPSVSHNTCVAPHLSAYLSEVMRIVDDGVRKLTKQTQHDFDAYIGSSARPVISRLQLTVYQNSESLRKQHADLVRLEATNVEQHADLVRLKATNVEQHADLVRLKATNVEQHADLIRLKATDVEQHAELVDLRAGNALLAIKVSAQDDKLRLQDDQLRQLQSQIRLLLTNLGLDSR